LFLTNALGFSDDIASIKKMCAANNIILLEDNCESLGSKHSGKLLGNFGLASTFSFYVGHHLSTVEGGMVATDDERLYEMLIMTRAHGWDRNLTFESATILKKVHGIDGFFSRYTFYDLAYNVRPTEIQGYLGNLQLRYWKKIVEVRRKNFLRLDKISRLNPDLLPVKHEQMDLISNFAFPLIFKSKELFNLYKTKFERAGVEIRPIISGNMTAQPVFKKYVGLTRCPNAEFVHENGFYFGNNPDMTKSELETLGKLLEKN
jgi:CDP-6-deoxy-D-xylo-4-hexulose-3-dehydrase